MVQKPVDQLRAPTLLTLALYCALFFAVWTLREFCLKPVIGDAFSTWVAAWINAATKLLLWTLPAALLIWRYAPNLWAAPTELLGVRLRWTPYVLVTLATFAYQIALALIRHGTIAANPDMQPESLIGAVLFAGITEEVVYRGWLLNAALKFQKKSPAVLLNAGLFVLIHLPKWFHEGMFANPITGIGNCASIFLLSLIFAWAFMKSKSLWPPIVLHMAWNLSALLFAGG